MPNTKFLYRTGNADLPSAVDSYPLLSEDGSQWKSAKMHDGSIAIKTELVRTITDDSIAGIFMSVVFTPGRIFAFVVGSPTGGCGAVPSYRCGLIRGGQRNPRNSNISFSSNIA